MHITRIFIDRGEEKNPLVDRFLHRTNASVEIIDDPHRVFDEVSASKDPIKNGKEILYLTRNRGAFIKDCPGTKNYICCGYRILHIGTFCVMDCSYCILQAYFHPPVLQYFVNHDDLSSELDRFFETSDIARVGTGEFTDSLIWEPSTGLSRFLVNRFSEQSRKVLELKSKTVNIEGLKGLDHKRKTIMAWSMNTEKMIRSQERATATLDARLAAAKKCESWGYPLAFHFDPMFIYKGCEQDYRQVVERIFSSVSSENIVWISLGAFRFIPALKPIIQDRFPDSDIVYGEFIPGLDGKMRYFKPLRVRLYKKMFTWIKELAPDVTTYFCMEDEGAWKEAAGFIPEDLGGLPSMLDESASRVCLLS